MALNANVLAALLPFLVEPLALSKADQGWLLGSAGLAGAAGALLLGPVVDHVGRRPPMCWGMVVFVLASLGHLFASNLETLFAVRAVAGFAGGVVFTGASAAVADLVPYARRGRAMGVFSAGMFLALPMGLPLAQVFATAGWWQGIFLLQTAVGLFALVAYWRVLPRDLGRGNHFVDNLPHLKSGEIVASLVSVMIYVGAFYTAVQFAGTWLDTDGLIPRNEQWPVWVVLGLFSAAGALILTRFSDRFGKRRFVMLTTVLVAACCCALTQVEGIAGLLWVGIPLAAISAARTGPFQALISELVPQSARGTLMGTRACLVNVGTGVFPVLGGYVYANLAFDGVLFVAAGGIFLSYLVVQLWVKQK